MRVTSSLFVAALLRRAALAGAQGVVVRHGSDEAGAIFVTIDRLDGTVDLYSPAPQSLITDDDDLPSDRLFTRLAERVPPAEIDARFAREIRFDPDVWLVAIEDREGRSFVEIAKG
jgi:hypothetical protein